MAKKDWLALAQPSFWYDVNYRIVLCYLRGAYFIVAVTPKEGSAGLVPGNASFSMTMTCFCMTHFFFIWRWDLTIPYFDTLKLPCLNWFDLEIWQVRDSPLIQDDCLGHQLHNFLTLSSKSLWNSKRQFEKEFFCNFSIEYPKNIPWNIGVRVFSSRFPGFWLANHMIGGILWNIPLKHVFGMPYQFRYSTIFRNIPQHSTEYQYSMEI